MGSGMRVDMVFLREKVKRGEDKMSERMSLSRN